jgi:hypothetical protein
MIGRRCRLATFRDHTVSITQACSLWREYGSRIAATDQVYDLVTKFPELPTWKCRVLVTICRQLVAVQAPLPEALEQVFGEQWKEALEAPAASGEAGTPPPKERGFKKQTQGDETTVTHTGEGINRPITSLEDLVHYSNTDLATHEVASHKINSWSTVTKGNDGEPKVTRLWQVSASFRPRTIPLVAADWGPPPPYLPSGGYEAGLRQAVVFPDMQIGFRWVGLSEGDPWAEPFHDRRAIDIGLQVLATTQPEVVVLLGDNLDFQPLSLRWATPPTSMQTTAIALVEYRWLLWRIRQVSPRSRIVYMYGNHEDRLRKYLDERAGELQGITHADGRKAVCLRSILGLDALHVETVDYPQPYWLWDRVEIEHGRTVRRGGGATAARVASEREHSVIYGHIHRQEVAHRTIDTPRGKREYVVGSPGCLCRTDGIVPGSDRPDWQQGVGVLSLVDDMDEHLELVRIQDGKAFYGSQLLVGQDYVAEMVTTTGARALLPRELR